MAFYDFTGANALDETDDQVALSGQVYLRECVLSNPDAATVYVKFVDAATYDVSAAAPDFEVAIAAGESVKIPLGNRRHTTGLCMAATAAAGTGGAAPGASTVGWLVYDVD